MIKTYKNDELGTVRVITDENGIAWVCAKDVCDRIGLSNPTLTVQVRIANGLMSLKDRAILGDINPMLYVNKAGLQALATTRKKNKDKAMAVSQWLMETVFESGKDEEEVNDEPQQAMIDFDDVPTEELATQSDIQELKHPQFGRVRMIIDEMGKKWYNAKDVCDVLLYENARKAIRDHVNFSDVTKRYTTKNMGERLMLYINQTGLNLLIMKSKREEAKQIQYWLAGEVMPSIQEQGMYISSSRQITPAFLRDIADKMEQQDRMIAELQRQVIEKEQQAEENKGKVEFADAFHDSPEDIDMTMMARILADDGILWKGNPIGLKGIFEWMRRHHQCFYEWYYGSKCNVPEQTAINAGYLTTRMKPISQLNNQLKPVTYVTAKGRVYYLELFRKLKGDRATYDAYYDELDENGEPLTLKQLLNNELLAD